MVENRISFLFYILNGKIFVFFNFFYQFYTIFSLIIIISNTKKGKITILCLSAFDLFFFSVRSNTFVGIFLNYYRNEFNLVIASHNNISIFSHTHLNVDGTKINVICRKGKRKKNRLKFALYRRS